MNAVKFVTWTLAYLSLIIPFLELIAYNSLQLQSSYKLHTTFYSHLAAQVIQRTCCSINDFEILVMASIHLRLLFDMNKLVKILT